jgi:molybdopterin synthase catalytic subunit
MKTELTISTSEIDEAALAKCRKMGKGMGAVICFSGVVREIEDDAPITAIDYEAHEQMARHQFGLLFDAVEKRWPVESVRVVHRIGVVPVNEPSLWVEMIAPHRAEAFAACQFIIDEMKQKVPIWKKPLLT